MILLCFSFFPFLSLNNPGWRNGRPSARGARAPAREAGEPARAAAEAPAGSWSLSGDERRGRGLPAKRQSSGPGAVTAWGPGRRGRRWAGKRRWGQGEGRRALVVGAHRSRPAFHVPAGCERSRAPARGEIRAERTRAGDAGARLRGGDGPLGGAWVSVLNRGTGAERLSSDPKRRRGAAQRWRGSAATRRWCAPIWSPCGFGARMAPRARELS